MPDEKLLAAYEAAIAENPALKGENSEPKDPDPQPTDMVVGSKKGVA